MLRFLFATSVEKGLFCAFAFARPAMASTGNIFLKCFIIVQKCVINSKLHNNSI